MICTERGIGRKICSSGSGEYKAMKRRNVHEIGTGRMTVFRRNCKTLETCQAPTKPYSISKRKKTSSKMIKLGQCKYYASWQLTKHIVELFFKTDFQVGTSCKNGSSKLCHVLIFCSIGRLRHQEKEEMSEYVHNLEQGQLHDVSTVLGNQ